MRRLGYVPALDGLRGVAIILVVGHHAEGLIPGGGLGVDLFFVLSGFLITSLLLSEWGSNGRVDLRAFYGRRALRLLPALLLLLAVTVLVVALLVPDRIMRTLAGAGLAVAYVQNIVRGLGTTPEPAFDHFWSLAQEEQFYLAWPVLLILALRAGAGPRTLLLWLVGLAMLVTAHRNSLYADPTLRIERILYMPDTRLDSILLGCAGGVAYAYGLVRRIPPLLATVALLVTIPYIVGRGDVMPTFTGHVALFTVGCAIVVPACALNPHWIAQYPLQVRPLRWLGKISYGLYLWHWPCYMAFGWLVGLPVAVAMSSLSYRYVEKPLLRRRRYPASRGAEDPDAPPRLERVEGAAAATVILADPPSSAVVADTV